MGRKTALYSLRMDPIKAAAEKAAAEDRRPLASLIEVLLANHCKGRDGDAEARQPSKRGQK